MKNSALKFSILQLNLIIKYLYDVMFLTYQYYGDPISKIPSPSSPSPTLSDGFDPTKINIEMGGFRPVYQPGTVEYVDHTIR